MGKNRLAPKEKDRLKEKIIQSDKDFFKSISLEARNQLALMNEQLKKVYSSNDKTKIFVENKIAKVLKEFDAMEYKGYACKDELQKLTKQVETIKKDIVKNAGKEIEAVKKLIPSINLNDYYTRAEVDEKIMKQTFIVGGGGGASSFLNLTDTPTAYTGQAGMVVKVNATEDGLEFGVGGGGVQTVTGTAVDNTDPNNPVINLPGGSATWGGITGTLSNQTDLQNALNSKVDGNAPIAGATKTKITYDSKGLVTSGDDATTADIADSTDKRYVTDAQLTVIGNTSGTNTGDQDLSGYQLKSEKGANNGYAELDSNGKVPSGQLPSYVDDVLEYANLASFPVTGETGKIYIALDTNIIYRRSGTTYVEISSSLALGETSTTAYRGDRGKTAYDHSQTTGNPHGTVAGDITDFQTTVSANSDVSANTSARHDAVTLAGTPNYLTIAGQVITRALINLASHVTGRLPFANFETGTARSVVGRAGSGNGDVGNISAGNDTILSRSGSGDVAFNNASTTKTILALNNVDNTSDATKNSATATLTNKTISGSNNTLSDIPQSAVTNLTTDLGNKQATLVSGTNIKTVNGNSLLGSGDVTISGGLSNVVPLNLGGTSSAYTATTGLISSYSEDELFVVKPNDNNSAGATLNVNGLGAKDILHRDQSPVSAGYMSDTGVYLLKYVASDDVFIIVQDRTQIGLGNVDNTSDLNKPISTATQTALNAKENSITAGTTSQYWRGDKSRQTLDKTAVGLGNVDNTSDATKNSATATLTNKTIDGGNNTLQNIPQSSVTNLTTDLSGKQATLVSGTNIKTINGDSILGSGNLTISGGAGAGKYRFAIAGTIGATGTNVANTILVTESITVTKCHLWLGTAGNGTLIVDVNKNGTTMYSSSKPEITSTNQYAINTGTLTTTTAVSGDIITIDIDQVQATTKGIDLYVELEYTV